MKQLESNRLLLRNFQRQDLFDLGEMLMDPDVVSHTGFRRPFSQEQVQEHLDDKIRQSEVPFGVWGVWYKQDSKLVAWAMLKDTGESFMELGYMVNKNYWGKGIATELSQMIINHARDDLNLPAIMARCDPNNSVSRRVLERRGFALESSSSVQCVYLLRLNDKD
ncbi:MAG: GNAT family N-acetyltransferase [Pseudobacteriovorax sp.]|nr:GNAT family N-acetyltransferase [Pseudobacteriovorax sp.]